jgi:DeoR/GlpR family transcriptional regulator of sugar metabolism
LLIPERQTRLRETLARRGMADLDTLAAELEVSHSTIRRDLEAMERDGLVQRTHGGVIWTGGAGESRGSTRPYAFDQRMTCQLDAKKRIAHAARSLVQPGQTILIDGGTTTFFLAQELLGQQLQLVTNSLPIANLFINEERIELIVTGGLLYPRYGVLLGPMAEAALAAIHISTMFLSVGGIHDGALYNQNLLLVQAENQMMRQSQRVVLLADSSKFGQQALVRLCGLDQVHIVVSDAALPPEHQQAIRDAGCQLVLAE